MKPALLISLVIVALLGIAYAAGVRIFIVKPIGAVPEGRTVIVFGASGLNAVDSPDAFCLRNQGNVTLICRAAAISAVVNKGKILLRLPYIGILDKLAGTPETDR